MMRYTLLATVCASLVGTPRSTDIVFGNQLRPSILLHTACQAGTHSTLKTGLPWARNVSLYSCQNIVIRAIGGKVVVMYTPVEDPR